MAGQVWGTATTGGYMYSDRLSDDLRIVVQPLAKCRQFADVVDENFTGKHKGATVHWDIYSDVATQGTTLAEGSAMPETNFVISQGTMTMAQMGNSVPWTGMLDDLSYHPVKTIVTKALKNDAVKAFDLAVAAQFDTALVRHSAAGGTATDAIETVVTGTATATAVATAFFNNEHLKLVSDYMREGNVPPFVEDDYIALSRPNTMRPFKNSLEAIRKYTDEGYRQIMYGEQGRYDGVRFVEQTNVGVYGIGTPATAWPAGSGWIVFLGEDTVAEGIVCPEEIRGKIPTNYGLSKGVAWYYLGGFGLVHAAATGSRVHIWDSAQ